jgi:hypothetical protein
MDYKHTGDDNPKGKEVIQNQYSGFNLPVQHLWSLSMTIYRRPRKMHSRVAVAELRAS